MGAPTDKQTIGISGQHVTLASLLIVSVLLTLSWSTLIAELVVPVTLGITIAFWYRSRRIVGVRRLVWYCILGGAAGGVVDATLCYTFVTIVSHGSVVQVAIGFPSALLVGVVFGVGYGLCFLPPLLVQASTRGLRRSEALERCLIGCGVWLWAVTRLWLAFPGAAYQREFNVDLSLLAVPWAVAYSLSGYMLLIGVVPWVGRWWWLERVARGKVSGWRLSNLDEYGPGTLDGLPPFGKPLFPRSRRARVLVKLRAGDSYRSELSEPRYLVP